MTCKNHIINVYDKHCNKCGKSLVEIDKEIREKEKNGVGIYIKAKSS